MKLIICLKSDLCASSGEAFSNTIDNDVTYDKYGLPFIPGRRIKGCLRDVATKILSEKTCNEIFGVAGSENSGALHISNARIQNYENTVSFIKENPTNPQKILGLFTYTRAQTKIDDDGHATDGSLRFVRVVSHTINGKELCFEADVKISNEYKNDFTDLCKAFRNIGFNRNRGLGAIKCTILEDDNKIASVNCGNLSPEKQYSFNYSVKLESPLMLPDNNSLTSKDYISGTSVMGFLAGKIYKECGEAYANELFFNKKIICSNLYPLSGNKDKCIPAPKIIGKIKEETEKSKCYANMLTFDGGDKTIKAIKSGYVDSSYYPFNVESEIIYHHSTNQKVLYTQNCLTAGQVFYGSIIASGKDMEKILDKIKDGTMSFGRSKTAQYSLCRIIDSEICEYAIKNEKVIPNELCVYIALSDLLVPTNNGSYSATIGDIASLLGVTADIEKSSLSYNTVSGYNAKWNQKKPHIRAISKGSCIVFSAAKPEYPSELFIGEKQNEGFGKLKLFKVKDIVPTQKISDSNIQTSNGNIVLKSLLSEENEKYNSELNAMNFALKNKKALSSLNGAFIGRVLNMVDSSSNYEDLKLRFNSIKDKTKQDKVIKLLESSELISNEKYYKEILHTVFTLTKNLIKQEENDNDKNLL